VNPSSLQDTSPQGEIAREANSLMPLTSESTANLSNEASSQTVNTNGSQIGTDQNSLQSITLPAETSDSQNTAPTETDDGTAHIVMGVNYLSPYHMYSSKYTSDDILHRDFSRFQLDGISVISLSLYWYRLEGNARGSYDDGFLAGVKHVIAIANQYGIKVLVTFHTLWGKNDSPWCTPDYIVDPVSGSNIGLAIVRSDDMRQGFIDMFSHTIGYLAGTPGIWAWGILNEPWYWGTSIEHDFITNNGKTQKENFVTLFQELSNIVKTTDGRPVTIRFCNARMWIGADELPHIKNTFVDDWGWDPRVLDAVDFASFNVYLPAYSQLEYAWQNMTTINIIGCFEKNKQVWITEFGFVSNNQTEQADAYEMMLTFYASLPISGCLAWQWTSGNLPPGYDDPVSKTNGNICADIQTGTPKLAYETMLEFKTRNR